MLKIRAGRLIRVRNIGKKPAANQEYYAVWVENENGKNERCILLTDFELSRAEDRAKKNPEDLPEKSLFMDIID